MKAGIEQKLQDNEVVTYHVVDVAGRRSMAEDILGGCVYRDIAVSGRAGWPTAPCRAAEVAMSKPFRACGAGWAKPTPCWQAEESNRIMHQNFARSA